MSKEIKLKRPECADCEYWEVKTGSFLQYENPVAETEARVNAETGVTEHVLKMPEIKIQSYGRDHETRAWCNFPFGLCKIEAKGRKYVICDSCPAFGGCGTTCRISLEDAEHYKNDSIVLAENCDMIKIQTKRGVYRSTEGVFDA